ncbi:MAG: hypothetical protein WC604_02065 [Candidatus Gracilibacteria bacterium]
MEAKTDAEKLFAEQLGKEGGIRPEFAREVLEGRAQTHEKTQTVMAGVGEKPATQPVPAVEPAVEPPKIAKPVESPLVILSKCPHSPEHRKYIENVVGTAIPNVRKSFRNAGIAIPTDDEILQQMVMTERFRPEQIEALIKAVQTPGLIVLPPQMQSFGDYERFLNANKKIIRQKDVFVSDDRKAAFVAQDTKLQQSPTSYKFGIGELAQELRDRSGKLKSIVTEWEGSDLAKVLRVPTPREYAGLQGQAPNLLDLNGWSMLSEENEPHKIIGEDNFVSGGSGYYYWGDAAWVGFFDTNPVNDYYCARVRPVVVK